MRRPLVIVFAKAPTLGRVKTRLARDIGQAPARRFYIQETNRLLARLARDGSFDVMLAVAPDAAAVRGRWWPAGVARRRQGHGDLGHRMARALAAARPRPVVVIGSDIPEIDTARLRAAFHALATADLVLGPAADGGYWLVGTRAPALLHRLFRHVRWSGPHARADTLANLPAGRRVALLDVLEDIDEGADLERLNRRRRSRVP